jgi:hypothetical protein
MLYWICPECGHECSPAIRECPTCAAPPEHKSPARKSTVQQQTAVSQELLTLAQHFHAPPSTGLLAAAPQRRLLTAAKGAAVAVEEPEKAVQPKEPGLSLNLAPLDNLSLTPARPANSLQLSPTPVPVSISGPAVAPSNRPKVAQLGLQPAGFAHVGEISFQASPCGHATALDQPAEPLPSCRRSVAFVRAELPAADHSGLAPADFAQLISQPADAWLKPVVPYQNGQPQNGKPGHDVSAPLPYQPNGPSFVASRLKLTGESLAELQKALEASAEDLERQAIDAIQASFRQQPAACLLAAPAEVVKAPAPPGYQWMQSQKPKFTPIEPESTGRGNVIAGPQAPPLAGPSLPRQLINLDQQNSGLRANRKRSGWPITLLIGTVVILGAVSLLQFVTQDHDSKTPVEVAAQAAQSAPVAAVPAVPVLQEHPAARSVEVAGVRIVTGPNKRPQLQFLVINHSANELTGLNIRIAVRSVDGLSGPPLFSVSSVVAALGPNQSKEIRTDLDASIKPSTIPDWQSLRTEVLVARQ